MNCPCGQPLHYTNPHTQEYIEAMILLLGETIVIKKMGGGAWHVPRHYIALHGIKAAELPELAEKYGWKKVE